MSATQIAQWTVKDSTLSRVHHVILHGWPDICLDSVFLPYFRRKEELSTVDGCVLWGSRVVIPTVAVVQQLHDCHPGISKMKSLARSYVWWPGLHNDITRTVQQCEICQNSRPNPPSAPLHPWEWPSRPWSQVPSTSAEATISKLRIIFSTFGLADQLVSDNGTGFTSAEFRTFLSANGIRQILTSPYHPSSNRLAERVVQTFKQSVTKLEGSKEERL